MRTLVSGLAAVLALTAAADEVYLKSGGQLSGRVVSRTAAMVEIDVGAGRVTVPTSSIVRIEEGRSALQEYEERAGRIPASDVEAWLALGEWASRRGLGTQAREAYHRALAASPNDPRANNAVGNAQVDGRWVSEEEGYRARGFVRFEGEWMTPAEQEAILRQRSAEDAQEHARRQAEIRAREADARAQEAEARARKAEADAKAQQNEGLPLWYGWGAGPVAWPTGPIITQPIGPARPIVVPR
jgi:tetratricopeptide (TPR) repeat protein